MKKIVILTSHAPSLINFRSALIQSLVGKGVRVFAVAPNFDEQTWSSVKALGASPVPCPIERVGMNPVRDFVNTLKLLRLLNELGPDVVLGYFIKPVIFGSIAGFFAGVPRRFAMVEGLGFVFTADASSLTIKRQLLKRLVMLLYKLGILCADRVIFLNPDDQAELINARVLPASKSFLLGGIGVDLKRWMMAPPFFKPVTFLLVARLLRAKGICEYADAARIVKKKHSEVRFILLGGLDENPGSITSAEVQVWVNEGTLEWYGHVPVQPWLRRSSVYVLPSYREGVPASTQEAMAMGRPVITTDVPGCRETVIDGVNGYLVPVRDAHALADKMCVFIKNPEYISRMGLESRRLAEERFDVHKVNQRLINLIFDGDGVLSR